MEWVALDWDDGLVEVDKQKVKGKSKRFVPMQQNLREWLLPYRRHNGKITPKNFRRHFDSARETAGIKKDWLDNMRVEFRIIQVEAEDSVFKPL